MFSARGNAASPEEDLGPDQGLGPWITSEDLAALNLHEVCSTCQGCRGRTAGCDNLLFHNLLFVSYWWGPSLRWDGLMSKSALTLDRLPYLVHAYADDRVCSA